MASTNLYRKDLARIHHEAFGDFSRRATPGLLAMLREAGIRRGTIVDLGCGSGLWLHRLTRAGHRAIGIDASPSMCRLARKAAPEARIRTGSVHDLALPSCDAITALGEVFNYLPAGGARRASLPALFSKLAGALRPGGLLAFDLLVAGRGRPMAYRTSREGDGWAVLVEVREDVRAGRLTRTIVTFVRAGAKWRRSGEEHVLQVPRRRDVARWLRSAGFTVRAGRRYGRFEVAPRRLVFRARRVRDRQ